jgi:hypothetical protein
MGLYYDRKVLEYGYLGLGSSLLPPAENTQTGEMHGGIWGTVFAGCNTPNLFRHRLFGEVGIQSQLVGDANPRGVHLVGTLGYAFQSPGGLDLQLGCTMGFLPGYFGFCGPRLDVGGAF